MRSDMGKILIERPRVGMRVKTPKGSRRFENHLEKMELLPKKEPLRKVWKRTGKEKDFSDLLGPIIRFLRSKIGSKWNDIYSEICEQSVDSHFLRHIDDFVKKNLNGRNYFFLFYVDNEGYLREIEKEKKEKQKKEREIENNSTIPIKIKGIYYNVTVRRLPEYLDGRKVGPYDIVLHKHIYSFFDTEKLYRGCYAIAKEQLNKKEIKKLSGDKK